MFGPELIKLVALVPKTVLIETFRVALDTYSKTGDLEELEKACVMFLAYKHLEYHNGNVRNAVEEVNRKLHTLSLFENKEN